MKQNKIVYFYTLTIAALILFSLIVSGVVQLNIPAPSFTKSTPDLTTTEIRTLCSLKKYDTIAFNSLKYVNGEYSLIESRDFSMGVSQDRVDYMASVKQLCNWFDIMRKIDKKQLANGNWEYTFYAGILFDSNHSYQIHMYQNSWKYVLGK